jgi:hypothetical protein
MVKKLLLIMISLMGLNALAQNNNEGIKEKLHSLAEKHGYKHTIINETEFPLKVQVHYNACKNDTFVFEPGETRDNKAKFCQIKEISAYSINNPSLKGNRSFHVFKLQGGIYIRKNLKISIFESKNKKMLGVHVWKAEESAQ